MDRASFTQQRIDEAAKAQIMTDATDTAVIFKLYSDITLWQAIHAVCGWEGSMLLSDRGLALRKALFMRTGVWRIKWIEKYTTRVQQLNLLIAISEDAPRDYSD